LPQLISPEQSRQNFQSSSASRITAGAFGFLTLTQCGERPERYGGAKISETAEQEVRLPPLRNNRLLRLDNAQPERVTRNMRGY
jgi:hypothetical protein